MMDTSTLAVGIAGFPLGGLLVSVAAEFETSQDAVHDGGSHSAVGGRY